jgi:hypothetical protein
MTDNIGQWFYDLFMEKDPRRIEALKRAKKRKAK